MASRGVTWTTEEIDTLIDLYEQYPCLYNVRDSAYHDRDKRNSAFHDIATAQVCEND